ncbi:MAG: hypothetical protein JWN77_1115 [Frankiales bacterium]|jgi:uncharacterized membrane protein YbhN (UPF0104 family)|nr:hypothetical protein [Frankiales bacterium]
MNPVALVPLLSCWAAGVLLATAGRRYAARRFAGADLSFRHVLGAQLAGTALNRLVPAGGGLVTAHLALLRRRTTDGPHLGAALGGYAAGGALAHLMLTTASLGLLVTGVVTIPTHAPTLPVLPWAWLGLAVGALGLVAAVLVRRHPGVLSRTADGVRAAWRIVRSRRGAVLRLAAYQVGTALLAAAALSAALWATGTTLPLLTVLALYLLTSTLAAALPAPAGTGPLEAGLITALTLVGVAFVPAAAAVVLFRLVTHWLPVPLGLVVGAAALRRRSLPLLTAGPAPVTA